MRISRRNLALGGALLLWMACSPFATRLWVEPTVAAFERTFASKEWGHFSEGRRHTKHLRHMEAVAAFSRAIELAPEKPDSYIYRGHAYLSLQKPAESVRDYTAYLALRPETANALWGRAQAHNDLGTYANAIADADAALAVAPNLAGALYHRAFAWARLGNISAARADVAAGLASGTADDCINGLLEELHRKLDDGHCEALISGLQAPLDTAELVAAVR